MVQILKPARDPLNEFLRGAAQAVPDALDRYNQQKLQAEQQFKQRQQGQAASQFYGQDIGNLAPDVQKGLLMQKGEELQNERYRQNIYGNRPTQPQSDKEGQLQPGTLEWYEKLTPEEKGYFARTLPKEYQVYENALKQKNKAPQGGITAQPVDPETGRIAGDLAANNPDASADQLKALMDKNGIPPYISNSYVENRRRMNERDADDKMKIHTSWQKYEEDLRDRSEQSKRQLAAIEDISRVGKKASKPWSPANWSKALGPLGEKLANAMQTAEQGQFDAAIPALIEGFREMFGVRITDADLQILKSKLPDWGKDAATNEAIMNILKKYAEKNVAKERFAREVKKENKGYRPIDFDDQVAERYNDWERKHNIKYEIKQQYEPLPNDYTYIQLPDGQVKKIPKKSIQYVPEGTIVVDE